MCEKVCKYRHTVLENENLESTHKKIKTIDDIYAS